MPTLLPALSGGRLRPLRPLRRALRLLVGGLLLGGLVGLGACGAAPPPGGHGRLERVAGGPDILHLEGSPYEMGWWHGHLLRTRIVGLRERWEAALFQATAGSGSNGSDGQGAAGALRAHGLLCEDQTRYNLSETLRQELDGMAAATGLEPQELLWIDVLRDALRMKGLEARLPGALGLARTGPGLEARAWWGGADAERLGAEALVIHRTPPTGPQSLVFSWPGSLGAIAGILSDGRGYLLADTEIQDGRKRGFGAGRPMNIAAREALPLSPGVGHFMAATKATMGHVLLGFSLDPRAEGHPVRAMAGLVYYVDPDPPRVLEEERFLFAVPYENENDPRLEALQSAGRDAEAASTFDPEPLWMLLRTHADGAGLATGAGLRVHLRHEGGISTLEAWGAGAAPARVVLSPRRPDLAPR